MASVDVLETWEPVGSTQRGLVSTAQAREAGVSRDIDLLYTLAPGARLGWEIEDLSDELAVVFGRRVDLVARRALHPALREHVLLEAEPVHAAA
ncbi:nucleotidyltransferase family protein [Tessaracoccus sp. Z1128]